MQRLHLNFRRKIGYFIGIVVVLFIVIILILPQSRKLHANGPSNIGHEKLKCPHCHKEAVGTLRQQLQANLQYLLGNRNFVVSVGLKPVSNNECIYCHERPNDRHPVYRFFEPKYKKIQQRIQPQFCISCHREHSGKRVTSDTVFCKNCHKKLRLKKDPITRSHQQLVKNKDWKSCLGCHDYHGNHRMKVNTQYKNKITNNTIINYFNNSDSPYSKLKFHQVAQTKLGD